MHQHKFVHKFYFKEWIRISNIRKENSATRLSFTENTALHFLYWTDSLSTSFFSPPPPTPPPQKTELVDANRSPDSRNPHPTPSPPWENEFPHNLELLYSQACIKQTPFISG